MEYVGRVERAKKTDEIRLLFDGIKAEDTLYSKAKEYNASGGQRPDETSVRDAIKRLEKINYRLGQMTTNGGDARRINSAIAICSIYKNQLLRSINAL